MLMTVRQRENVQRVLVSTGGNAKNFTLMLNDLDVNDDDAD